MTNIVLNSGKVIKVNIFETIILGIILFISLSAGTQWGYAYRGNVIKLLGICCLIGLIVKNRINLYIETKFCLFIAIYIFVSSFFSIDSYATRQWSIYYASMLLVVVYGFAPQFWNKYRNICFFWAVFIAATVLLSAFSTNLFLCLFGWLLGPGGSGSASFLKRASLGQYAGGAAEIAEAAVICNYGIAVCYAKIFSGKVIKSKDIFAMVILFLGLILTTKRTLFLISILLIPFLILFTQKNISKKIKWISLFIIFGTILFILMVNVPQLSKILERFAETDNYSDMGGRAVLWQISKEMFANSKLFGQGYGSYNTYAYDWGFRFMGQKWVSNGHNIYLQLLGEMGILGFIIIIGSLVLIFIKTLIGLKSSDEVEDKESLIFCVYIQIMFFIYGITGNVLLYPQQVMMWVIAIAYSLSILNKRNRRAIR